MAGIEGYSPSCFWSAVPLKEVERLLGGGNEGWWGDVNDPYNGSTKLHWAAKYTQNPLVIKALLDAGALTDTVDGDGKTPIEVARDAENVVTIQALEDACREE